MLFLYLVLKLNPMKKIIFSSFFTFASLFSIAQCNLNSAFNFSFNNHNYTVVKDAKTWSAAASCAKSQGGYLVEINDTLENIAVYNAITQGATVSNTYTSVPDGGGAAYVWIGAHDVVEGTWIWDGDNDSIGTIFFNGEGSNGMNNGVVVGNNFVNWGNTGNGFNEPDNYAGSQDAAAMALAGWPSGIGFLGSSSQWNDLNPTNTLYYVIEKPLSLGESLINENKLYTLTKLSNYEWQLNGSASEPELIEILDASGRNVKVPFQGLHFNTESLPSGMYLIKLVTANNQIQYLRFVK